MEKSPRILQTRTASCSQTAARCRRLATSRTTTHHSSRTRWREPSRIPRPVGFRREDRRSGSMRAVGPPDGYERPGTDQAGSANSLARSRARLSRSTAAASTASFANDFSWLHSRCALAHSRCASLSSYSCCRRRTNRSVFSSILVARRLPTIPQTTATARATTRKACRALCSEESAVRGPRVRGSVDGFGRPTGSAPGKGTRQGNHGQHTRVRSCMAAVCGISVAVST